MNATFDINQQVPGPQMDSPDMVFMPIPPDAFMYDYRTTERPMMLRWRTAALEGLEFLRHTRKAYRPKIVVGFDWTEYWTYRENKFYEVKVAPGSWLYAVQASASAVVTVQITEAETGLKLWDREPISTFIGQGGPTRPSPTTPSTTPIVGRALHYLPTPLALSGGTLVFEAWSQIIPLDDEEEPVESVQGQLQVIAFIAEPVTEASKYVTCSS